MRPIDCLSIVESVKGISFDEWCDLPVVLFPRETELVSVVNDCLTILECPSGLDFGIEMDGSIKMRGILKDEPISPVTLFLVKVSILHPVFDGEVLV